MGFEILVLVLSLLIVFFLTILWRNRLRVMGFALLLASVYLLFTSDVFLVIRVPTICLVGLGIMLAIMIMTPIHQPQSAKNAAHVNNHR